LEGSSFRILFVRISLSLSVKTPNLKSETGLKGLSGKNRMKRIPTRMVKIPSS
jgi:hypothetical protein